ncbi:hypothetical protein A5906_19645 [Bradyrhizobium sacchari]|uniref:Uncharacterized membrane protein YhaH (DUF805 family) n=1 Tax=Bradyrhizobium sacchari TaxID=1399419 RepID=A0A560KDT2_9BRAD|nr:DUF805 domain-containing protein [Bradyrhizobium sacchari]OPZ00407.1 hypothetical protein A5906_19645 [Bradyrhizobium sacchari]TWB64836.1 uncharacterized membrane protein YhaH (DUF805 family) [Bradyrhizobium sacchari]TWB81159.1 uncharacterized membrane protein YhaH (DUF805 family) [Bradyrhizobium sacchari]
MDFVWLLFSFKGRLNRARYLIVELALLAVWVVALYGSSFLVSSPETSSWLVAIPMIWINMATTAKRLHDRNRSGWWAVAVFVVNRLSYLYYGLFFGLSFGVDISTAREMLLVMFAVVLSLLQTWVVIELFFVIGTDGPNRFGPDPTRTAPVAAVASRPEPQDVPDFLVRRSGPFPPGARG